MNTQGNNPAYPLMPSHTDPNSVMGENYQGMTIRQQFAMAAMQAYAGADHVGNSGMPHEEIAEWAVKQADALIVALNKGGENA